jgi:multiple sugar transport system permease protein
MIVPLFLVINKMGLMDTKIALIVVYTGINLPFAIWMLKGFIDEIPKTLEDAAMVDGCTKFAALIKVTLPLIAPGVAAVGIFTFLLCWNDFQLAFFLVAKDAKTLPLQSVAFITEGGIHYGPMSVFGSIVLFPAILFSFFCQKYITRGLTMGAVKG